MVENAFGIFGKQVQGTVNDNGAEAKGSWRHCVNMCGLT